MGKRPKERATKQLTPHEVTDEMIAELMVGAEPDVLSLCEVALDQSSPITARVCRDGILSIILSREGE